VNVLVVGGAGFVGGAVTDALGETNHNVRVFDALLYEDAYLKPVDFVRGDVRDHVAMHPQLGWADCVVWLAARVAEATCDLEPIVAQQVNVAAVRAMRERFEGRVIFTSTSAVYGRSAEVLTETSPLGPRTLYSRTKVEAERELAGTDCLIFRLATLYGLGDPFSRPRFDLAVNTMTLAAATTGSLTVFGGKQYRPFLHVRDAARAIVEAIPQPATGVFNIHGENVRIDELAARFAQHFTGLQIHTQPEVGQMESYRLNSNQANMALGFQPKLLIDDGIAEIRSLVESGRIPNLSSHRFRNHLHIGSQPASRQVS
jgi:nucleoside-diphosphate-sugar epimerase